MGRRNHRVEARREEAEKVAASLCSALDVERADLEAARDNAKGILLLKCDLDQALASAKGEVGDLRSLNCDLEASVLCLTNQAKQDRERISGLLSKIDILQVELDEAIRKAAAAEDKALQSLVGPPPLLLGRCLLLPMTLVRDRPLVRRR